MKAAWILLACTLAACSAEPEVDARNASAQEVAEQVADAGGTASFVRPGKWQSRMQIEQFELPGAPPEAASAMRAMQERLQTGESCLEAEDVKRPNGDFFGAPGKNCRYDHFTMGGGKIDAVMQCSGDGTTQSMAMQGTYSADAYQMRVSLNADAGAGPAGGMKMKMRVDAKRIGECDKVL